MKKMAFFILLPVAFSLTSCVPTGNPSATRATPALTATAGGNPSSSYLPFEEKEENRIFWFSAPTATLTTPHAITFGGKNGSPVYLRGNDVQRFLGNGDRMHAIFCLTADFAASSTVKKQIRLRAIPIRNNQEYLFKIDVHETSAVSMSSCSGTLAINSTTTATTAESAFSTTEICPTCISAVNAKDKTLALYR